MPTNLINIARSGALAARSSIELTAQNIANAGNADYVRRSLSVNESIGIATIDFQTSSTLNGVRIGGVQRANSELVQRQARDSSSDLARAETELSGLRDAETALENSGLYRGLVNFEASLTLLESDPTDPALRTGAIETARQLVETFHFADSALANSRALVEDDISVGVEVVNGAAVELARINQELTNARDGTAGKAALLDARDAALRDIAEEFGTIVSFDDKGRAEVRVTANPPPAGQSGVLLVSGVTANPVSATILPDGSTQIEIDGNQFAPVSGSIAGRASALADIASRQDDLNTAALETINRLNTAQSNGAALDGSAGTPLFSGSTAADITLVLEDGDGLALAAAGSPAGSRDTSNLSAMLASYGADDGPINTIDRSLLSLSSRIAGLDTTREGLSIINASAQAELLTETGVDLDVEAANLVRLQQAFEANSRVIQVASELFDTILGLR